jgi:hypothetical protein
LSKCVQYAREVLFPRVCDHAKWFWPGVRETHAWL